MEWVPLHVHSQYSILESTASPEEIAKRAKKFGLSACALTDKGNLFGAVEFYKACEAEGIKPIIGCQLFLAPESRHTKRKCPDTNRASFPLILLVKNETGYKNLCTLSSKGYLEGFYYDPRVDLELLTQHKEGLICLTGDLGGRLAYEVLHGSPESTQGWIKTLKEIFEEDLYLEVLSHPLSEKEIEKDGMKREGWLYQSYLDFIRREEKVNDTLFRLSKELHIPIVATQDVHYLDREDWQAHEILLNIQSGEPAEIWERDSLGNPKSRQSNPKRRVFPSHAYHFRSTEEMEQLFEGREEALRRTVEVSDKCQFKLDFKSKHYPVYTPPDLEGKVVSKEERKAAAVDFLWHLCREGIKKRYNEQTLAKIQEFYPGQDPLEVVQKRLEYEMGVIVPKEMSDYLLIVWDFINWAKTKGIPVGPGRGSGAGSIVLYLIGITDIEPLRFQLFFERFINPERISYPDIDVDICMERRGEVIHYTLEKYGRDNVAQIITFGTMKARMAIKDVGRVLSVPLSKVNEIAKLVPDDLNITIEKALEKDPDLRALYETDSEAKRVIDIARRLEGSIRNTGVHAAGIVISGDPLTEHIPLTAAKDSTIPVTQFSMKPVEAVGILKIDFLGLKTLTSIQLTVDAIYERLGIKVDWVNLPLDDSKTFQLLNQGKTLGVFQIETGGMQDLARQLHLDRFEEIIAVTSLYRPGPMDMIPSFIQRKHGREAIEIDHPWMGEILQETYGIMVYQEQVMQIASKLANYSLGEGDILRRAMGKKELDKMAQQREKFRQGCLANGIPEAISMVIFDKMEKFASYGFNKSHAAAYGYLTYVTAFLKAHYPKDWMAALMTCDSHDVSKLAKLINESQTMGISLLPPDINESNKSFFASEAGIRFGMGGIKGVGEGVVDAILDERRKKGSYKDFYDFLKRSDLKKVGKKGVELLIDAGCFAFTSWTKDQLKLVLDPMYDMVSKDQKDASIGFLSFFGDMGGEQFKTPPLVVKPTSPLEDLFKQKELLGFFLTGHPIDYYKDILRRAGVVPLSQGQTQEDEAIFRSAFLIEEIKFRFASKSQKKFALLTVSDQSGRMELPIWPELYEKKGEILAENRLFLSVIESQGSLDSRKISCVWIEDLSRVDPSSLDECDRQYDRAKQRLEMRKIAPKDKPKPILEREKGIPLKHFRLKTSLEVLKMSHVIHLKKTFREFPGKTPIEIHFLAQGKGVATVSIGEPWGVEVSEELKSRLKQLPFEVE